MKNIIMIFFASCILVTTQAQSMQDNKTPEKDDAEYFADADSIKGEPNGTLTIIYPDRRVVTYYPDGVMRTILPDGTKIFEPQPTNR